MPEHASNDFPGDHSSPALCYVSLFGPLGASRLVGRVLAREVLACMAAVSAGDA